MIFIFWTLIILMTLIASGFVLFPLFKHRYLSPKILLFFLAIVPVVCLYCYLYWGASKNLFHYWALQEQSRIVKQELATIKNPQQIVDRITSHLKQHPESAKGWYLLGRLYFGMQQYQNANQALETAFQLKPNDEQYLVAYAEANFMLNHRLSATLKTLLENLDKRSNNNTAVINLLAMNAYLTKDYHSAIQYWRRLIPLYEPGSADSEMILSMIAKAQGQLEVVH